MPKSLQNYTTLLLALLGMGLLGIWLQEVTLSTGIFLAVGLMEARIIGQAVFPALGVGKQRMLGGFLLVSSLILLGSAAYLVSRFGRIEAAALWLALGLACAWIHERTFSRTPKKTNPFWQTDTRHPAAFLLAVAVAGLDATALAFLTRSATLEAIRSPWEAVPAVFFVCFGVASLALMALASLGARRLTVAICLLHAAIALSVATIVYPLGYGFDGFIHARTEQMIVADGAVFPKTPYYIGQYVPVAYAAHLTHIPASVIDRLLGPAAFLLLPLLALWIALRARKEGAEPPLLAMLFPLFTPFGAFIATTPLALAMVGAITTLAALLAVPDHKKALLVSLLGASATAAIHPMVGIPLVGAILLLAPARFAWRRVVSFLVSTAGVLLLVGGVPLAFAANNLLGNGLQVLFVPSLALSGLKETIALFLPQVWLSGSGWLDTLTYWNMATAFFPFAGTIVCFLYGPALWQRLAIRSLVVAMALWVSFFVLGMMTFSLGGDTGGADFPFRARMIALAGLFLFPTAVAGWALIAERMMSLPRLRVVASVGLALAMTATLAVSYPRADRLETSKGYNVSAATFHAVDAILAQAPDDYIILANQTVAAAAIERAGFPHYYHGNFYVSHASAAPDLETFFLAMNQNPSQVVAESAMQFAGVNTAYFVVHDYWKNSAQISAAAQKEAADAFDIDGGKVHVFVFEKKD